MLSERATIMTSFKVKRASKQIIILLDLAKAMELQKLADRLTDLRASAPNFESESSGLEQRRLSEELAKKSAELSGGADTLVLSITAITASEYEQIAIQSRRKVNGGTEIDVVKLVTLMLKTAPVTATLGGEKVDFTDENIDELIDSATDWQLGELYAVILELNANGALPKAILQRASLMTRA